MQINNLTTSSTPDQYLNSLMRGDAADYKDFPDIKFTSNTTSNVVLAGHPGFLLNGTFRDPASDQLQKFTNIGTIIGDKEYSVIYYSSAQTYPVYSTIYLQMIKSLEVMSQKSSAATTNLMSDVRVVSEQEQRTSGLFLTIHYIVYGNVANFGNGPSGPVTLHLEITSPQGAVLLSKDGSTNPGYSLAKTGGQIHLRVLL